MIYSTIYRGTTLAAVLLISAAAGAQTTTAPKQQPPVASSTITATNADGKDFSLLLAKAELGKQGVKHPTRRQIDEARSSIQSRRSQGEGWGEIAHSMGLNFGKVVSASNHHKQGGKHSAKGKLKNAKDGRAVASHSSINGAGGTTGHGEHSDHSSGAAGGSKPGK